MKAPIVGEQSRVRPELIRRILNRSRRLAASGLALLLVTTAGAARAKTDEVKSATVQVEVDPPLEAKGATVIVNGKDIGPAPLSLTLQAGRYLIEVAKAGRETWRKWLDVGEGEQKVLRASLLAPAPPAAEAAKTGALVVASDALDAAVWVDDKPMGKVPALVEQLTPGIHRVEVRAGERRRTTEVTVRAGETTKLSLALAEAATDERAPAAPTGSAGSAAPAAPAAPASESAPSSATPAPATLEIVTVPEAADIYVDGVVRGRSPLTLDDLDGGAHQIEARLVGRAPVETTVDVAPGARRRLDLTLEAEVDARQGELVVRTSEPGAVVEVNGERLGTTPLRRKLLAGPHVVTVKREGYRDYIATADVRAGAVATLDAELEPRKVEHDAASSARSVAGATDTETGAGELGETNSLGVMGTYAARLVAPSDVSADFSTGFPYLAEARLTTGIADLGQIGIDGGVDVRTYGAMTELGFRGRVRLLQKGPWTIASSLTLGGGGGPKGRNTFYLEAAGVASVLVLKRLSLSLRGMLNIYSDRHCPASPDGDELAVCARPPAGVSLSEVRDRFGGLRFIMGAVAEYPLTDWLNLFGALELAPFQGNREAFSDRFAGIMPESDPGIYGRIGMTLRR